MLNLATLLEYPLSREISIGLIYGFALTATLAQPRRMAASRWCLLIIVAVYVTLAICQSWASQWTLSRTWTAAGLVCMTCVVNELRQRIGDFTGASRQFAISDLLILTTALAGFVAAIRQSSLADQEPIFWAGMLAIGAVLPCCVVFLRIERSGSAAVGAILSLIAATLIAIGLAWTESTLIQAERIKFDEACLRYGSLIAAMLVPRFLFQIIHHAWAATPTNDDHDNTRAMPRDDTPPVSAVAIEETQHALKLFE